MKTRMWKRLLAFMLVMTMVMSDASTVFAADSADTGVTATSEDVTSTDGTENNTEGDSTTGDTAGDGSTADTEVTKTPTPTPTAEVTETLSPTPTVEVTETPTPTEEVTPTPTPEATEEDLANVPMVTSVSASTLADGILSVRDDSNGTWTITNDSITGTVKASGFLGSKEAVLTVTNSSESTYEISFSADRNSTISSTSPVTLASGESFTIKISVVNYSPFGSSSKTTIISSISASLVLDTDDIIVNSGENGSVAVSYNTDNEGVSTVTSANIPELNTSTLKIIDGSTPQFTATPNSGYEFAYWADGEGNFLTSKNPYSFKCEGSSTVTAVFSAVGTATYYVETVKTSYTNLSDAITAANGSGKIILLTSGTVAAGEYTIPSGVTLLIPYAADQHTVNPSDAQHPYANDTQVTTKGEFDGPSKDLYLTWTIPSDVTINVNGGITVGGTTTADSGYMCGQTGGGTHSNIELNGKINVNSGAYLSSSGYIIGSGTITANGGNIYQPFIIGDYNGGTYTSVCVRGLNPPICPFSYYGVINIQTTYVLQNGANLYGYCDVTANDGHNLTTALLAGDDNAFLNYGSSMVVSYDGSKIYNNLGRDIIEIYGGGSMGSLVLNIGGVSVDTSTMVFPLGFTFDITIKGSGTTTTFTVPSDISIKMLPGFEIKVEEGIHVVLDGKLAIFDGNGLLQYAAVPYPSAEQLTTAGMAKRARYILNGTMTVNGALAGWVETTSNNAVITMAKGSSNSLTVIDGLNKDTDSWGDLGFATLAKPTASNRTTRTLTAWAKSMTTTGLQTTELLCSDEQDYVYYGSEASTALEGYSYSYVQNFSGIVGSGDKTVTYTDEYISGRWETGYSITVNSNGTAINDIKQYTPGTTNIAVTSVDTVTNTGYTLSDIAVLSGSTQTYPVTQSDGKVTVTIDTMPRQDLVIDLVWVAKTDTPYKVQQYYMNVDGTYPESAANTESHTGTIGSTVDVKTLYPASDGYVLDEEKSNLSATIAGDGTTIYKLYYARNQHNLILDIDGTRTEIPYYYGAAIATPSNPSKSGYTFTGWNPSIPSIMPDNDVTTTATWSIVDYTISYYIDSKETTYDSQYHSYTIESVLTLPSPTKNGYTFTGWKDRTTGKVMTEIVAGTYGNLVLDATWEANTYNVTFKVGEDSFSGTCKYKQLITVPDTVTKLGYHPGAWSYEGSGINLNTFTMPDKDITLTAEWVVNTFTVTYHVNRGNYTNSATRGVTFTYGDDQKLLTLSDLGFGRQYYRFEGWATSYNGSVEYASDYVNTVKNPIATENGVEVILYAVWSPLSYEITYELASGELESGVTNPTSYTVDTGTITINNPVRVGYTFAGWTGTGLDEATKDLTIDTSTGGVRSYTATWTANTDTKYTVNVYLMDTTGNYPDTPTVVELTGTTDTTVNYSDTKNGFTLDTTNSTLSGNIEGDGSLVLTAYYARNKYDLITKVDGDTTSTTSYYYEAAISTLENPTKAGYTFTGWTPNVPSTMPAENLTVEAKWQINQYTLTFDSVGGTSIDAITQDYNSDVTAPNDPEKQGYVFGGWYTDANYAEGTSATVPQNMPAENITYYAKWAPATNTKYTVETYQMDTDGNYAETATSSVEKFDGTTDVLLTLTDDSIKPSEGFSLDEDKSVLTGTVAADGSLVLKVYFERNTYNLITNVDGVTTKIPYLYGAAVSIPTTPIKTGYTFGSWSPSVPANMPAKDVTVTAQWIGNTYTVTFDTAGGSDVQSANVTYGLTYGNALSTINPTKTGYTFEGWYLDSTYQTKVTEETTVATDSDHVLYANWTPINYKVTLQLNGGVLGEEESKEISIPYASKYLVWIGDLIPTKSGYDFDGWYFENDFTTKVEAETVVSNTFAHNLYAKWTASKYGVTLDLVGGTLSEGTESSIEVAYDSPYGMIPEPTRAGYTFAGWYLASDYSGSAVTSSTIVATPYAHSLYAKWTANDNTKYIIEHYLMGTDGQYSIERSGYTDKTGITDTVITLTSDNVTERNGFTFDSENINNVLTGTIAGNESLVLKVYYYRNLYDLTTVIDGAKTTVSYYYGQSVKTIADPVKTGYTFEGWYTDNTYTIKAEVPTSMPYENVVLYAKFSINQYTLSFKTNGGSAIAPIQQNYATAITVPDNPTRTGYTFAGWYDNVDFAGEKVSIPTEMPAENKTYYAKWDANSYTIQFNGNNATSGEMPAQTFTYGEAGKLNKNQFVKTGYTFAGWGISNKVYDDESEILNLISGGTTTLTAIWKPITYSVVFNGNTGSGSMDTQSFTYDEDNSLTTLGFTKKGYHFVGWATSADGTVEYSNKESVKNLTAEDGAVVTLYAIWEANTYIVKFNVNGAAESISDDTFTYGGTSNAIPSVKLTKAGYTFIEWNTKSDGTGTGYQAGIISDNLSETDGDTITLYAIWSANPYTVVFEANGGDGTMSSMDFVYDQSQNLTKNTFVRAGYAFLGWSKDSSATEVDYNNCASVKNLAEAGTVTLYAVWAVGEDTPYEVHHYLQNIEDDNYTHVAEDDDSLTGVTNGNTNAQAKTYEGFTVQTFEQKTISGDGTTVVDIYYNRNVHTVTWKWGLDGKNDVPQDLKYGASIVVPDSFAEASQTGYTFNKWQYSATKAYTTEDTMPDNDVTITGSWTIVTSALKWIIEDDTDNSKESQVDYGTAVSKYVPAEKTGYTFSGWYTDAEYQTKATDIPSSMPEYALTYYGYWSANSHEVTLVPGEDANLPEGEECTVTVTYDSEYGTLPTPEKVGYTFDGWYTDDAFEGTKVTSSTIIKTDADHNLYAKFTVNNYTVSFNKNGASSGEMSDMAFTYGEEKALTKNAFKKTGYVFLGWATSEDGPKKYDDEATVVNLTAVDGEKVVLYAVWGASDDTPYTINHLWQNINDDEYTLYEKESATGTTGQLTSANAKKYTGVTSDAFEQVEIAADGSTVINILYDRNVHELTWNYTGDKTKTETQSLRYGAEITAPDDPAKTGYEFAGWIYEDDSAYETGNTMPDNDVVLTSSWNVKSYTINWTVYLPRGGFVGSQNIYDFGKTITAYEPAASVGYTFSGWYTDADCTQVAVIPGNMPANKLDFYGKYVANSYSIAFDVQGATTAEIDAQEFTYDTEAALMETVPEKTGYTFGGWSYGGKTYQPGDKIYNLIAEGTATFTAIWNPIQYKVVFNANTGKGSTAAITHTYDSDSNKVASSADFTKDGYSFKEWNTAADGSGDGYTSGVTVGNLSSTGNATVTLYAIWTANTYNVVFNGNGATGGSMENQEFVYDVEESLDTNTYERKGYHFIGWTTSADGDVLYTDGQEINVITKQNGTVELFAVWKPNTYTVIFDAGLEGVDTVSQAFTNGATQELTKNTFTKVGYTFSKWIDENGNEYTDKQEVTLADMPNESEVKLTAVWTANTNTVYTVNYQLPKLNDDGYVVITKTYTGTSDTEVTAPQIDETGFTAPAEQKITIAADGSAVLTYTYTRNMYTVTWDVDGVPSTEQFYYEAPITIKVIENKEGHTFKHWIDADENVLTASTTMPAEEVTYTAVWDVNTYKVNWSVDDSVISTDDILYGKNIVAPADPTKTGYTFGGWYTDAEFTNKVTDFGTMPATDVTYYCKWEPNTNTAYTVKHYQRPVSSFDDPVLVDTDHLTGTTDDVVVPDVKDYPGFVAPETQNVTILADGSLVVEYYYERAKYNLSWVCGNGLSTEVEALKYGEQIFQLANPTKAGYTFEGWYVDEDYTGTKITSFGTMPANDISYYAKWSINTYGISYTYNGGSWKSEVGKGAYTVETDTFVLPELQKTGYTFLGWTGSNGTTPELTVTIEKGTTGNLSYVANFEANTYKVVYDGNGATSGEMAEQSFVYDGDSKALTANVYLRTGYTFGGWSKNVDGSGTTYHDGENVRNLVSEGTITLYAIWNINQYTIRFDGDGGITSVDSITQDYGTDISVPDAPRRTGYLFNGWSPSIPETMPAEDMKLTAQWQPITYTVTFESNGGDGSMDSITLTYNASEYLPYNTFTKEGYSFDGWVFGLQSFTDGESVVNLSNTQDDVVVLNAKWKINSYSMTFKPENGESDTVITKYFGTEVSAPSSPKYQGYRFDYWMDESGEQATIPTIMPAVDRTYTAHWTSYLDLLYAIPISEFDDALTDTAEEAVLTTARNYYLQLNDEQIALYKSEAEDSIYAEHYEKFYEVIEAVSRRNLHTAIIEAEDATNETLYVDEYGRVAELDVYEDELHADAIFLCPECPAMEMLNTPFLTELFGYSEIVGVIINDSSSCQGSGFTQFDIMLAIAYETIGKNMGYTDMLTFADYLRQNRNITIDVLDGYDIKATVLVKTAEGVEYTEDYTIDFFNQCHDVTWVQNNSKDDVVVSTAYKTEITLPTEPTREGYSFAGWSDESGNTFAEGTLMGKTAVTYYAAWTINQYTITFNTDGGSEITPITGNYNSLVEAPKNPTKAGYTFAGWADETGAAVDVPDTMPGKDLTLTAQWTINSYNMIFDANGGTFGTDTTVKVEEDYLKEVSAPETDPTRTGYTFAGWYEDADCSGTVVTFPVTVPVNGKTYYAGWTANTYKVTLDADGGTLDGNITEVTVTYDQPYNLPTPKRAGYTFGGWYLNDTKISNTNIVDITNDISVVAKWEVGESFSITYDLAEGKWPASADVKDTFNAATPTFELPVPERTGYTFLGWTGSNGAEPQLTVSVTQGTAEDLSFTANWQINQYTITFNTDGGSEIASITQDYGTDIIAPADPTKTGCTFAGWDQTIPTTMPAKDMTITGSWTINQYKMTFVTNGGSEVRSITANYNAAITAPTDPTYEGYTFAGWYDNAELTGEAVTIPTVMPAENKTYYAKWTVNQYQITFDTNGGSEIAAITLNYGDTIVLPTDPTREGYTFSGWDKTVPATMPAYNIELTAKWSVNTYKVIYMVDGKEYDTQLVTYTGSVTALAEPTKVGYTFSGWSDVPEKMPAYDVTVTGSFTANAYAVSFDANYPAADAVEGMTVTYDAPYGTLPVVTRTGYTFAGWYLNDVLVTDTTTVSTAAVHTLVAAWTATTYRVTFDANGGTCDTEYVDVVYNEVYGTLPTPKLEGYDFVGWFDGDVQVTNETLVTITADQNLKARWNEAGDTPYTVKHYQQNLTGGYDLVLTEDTLTGATNAEVQATQQNYTGFYVNVEKSIASGVIAADGSLVLEIYYDRLSYTVVWNVANTELRETYLYGQTLVVPDTTWAADDHAGYTFTGWTTDLTEVVESDATYTAQYELDYEASIDGVTYRTLQIALGYAKSGETVRLDKDITLTEDLTIPAGINLLLPCIDDDWGYNLVDNGKLKFNHDNESQTSGTGVGPNAKLYRKMTIPKGVTLTVDGNVLINSVSGRKTGGTADMDITGGYAQIELDGNIVVNNGGNLDCFGYVTGSGLITAENGGSVGDLYIVRHWRGGTQALEMYQSIYTYGESDERQVYPMNEYDCHNIETTIIIKYGASYDGNVKMAANAGSGNAYYYTRFPQVNVDNGLIRLTDENGYVVRTYNKETGYDNYEIHGGALFAESSLNIAGVALSTKEFLYPIDGDITYDLYDGEYHFVNDYKFLTGGGMTVHSGAILQVDDGVYVAFYDEFIDVDNTGESEYPVREKCILKIEEGAKFINAGQFGGSIVTESADILIGDYPTWGITTLEANGYCNKTRKIYHDLYITREGYTWRYGDPSLGEVENSIIWVGADYTELMAALATVPSNLNIYSDETADPLRTVISEIEYGLGKDAQDQVDEWTRLVTEGVAALRLRKVKVIFNSNGGSNVDSIIVTYGDTYGKLPVPEYYGYEFIGWYDTDNMLITEDSVMKLIVNEVALTARYSKLPADYTKVDEAISMIPADMTGYTDESVQAVYEAESAVDRTLGLADQDKVDAMAQTILDAVAGLERVQITVTLDANGGTVTAATYELRYGDKYPYDQLPIPEREGYDFVAWFTAKDGGTQITENTTVASVIDVVLYARWTNSAVTEPADYSAVEAAIAKIPVDTAPYTAASVNRLNEAVNAVVYGLTVDRQDDVNAWAAAIEQAITGLTYKTITVSFDAVDGTCEVKSIQVTYGTAVTELPTASRDYSQFLGWYTAKEGGEKVEVESLSAKTENLTLYAQYELLPGDYSRIEEISAMIPDDLRCYSDASVELLNEALSQIVRGYTADKQTLIDRWADELLAAYEGLTYRIMTMTYDAQGGKVSPKSTEVQYNSTITWLPEPERTYHVFDGWYTMATGGNPVTVGTVVTNVEDFSIYAHWIQVDADYTKVEEEIAKLPEDMELYYTAETVAGVQVALDAVEYGLDASYQDQVNQWASNIRIARQKLTYKSFKVSFIYNGGTKGITSRVIRYNNTYGTLPETTKNGYTFLGWYTENTGGTKVESTTIMQRLENHSLYARWQEIGKADYSEVEAAIARIPADMTAAYTAETVKAVEDAVAAVEYGLSEEEQDRVDAWAVAINEAIDALEKAEVKEDVCEDGYVSPNCPSTSFVDLDLTAWYHLDVDYVVENGIMNGTGDSKFSPQETTTRAMIVTILYRLSGEPSVTASQIAQCKFTDIKKGEWYYNAVIWANANGVVKGTSTTTFSPDVAITREQMVTMLYRYTGEYLGYDTSESANLSVFPDAASISSYALNSVKWANAVGLLNGVQTGSTSYISPQGSTLREQAAAFIHRFCVKYGQEQ